MGLPFRAEPLEQLRARYADSLDPIIDVESVNLGLTQTPGCHRRHVFDFECGYRLIVSRDRHPDGEVITHLSAVVDPANPLSLMLAAKHWRQLCDEEKGLQLIGVSVGDVAHFVLVEPTPEIADVMREIREDR